MAGIADADPVEIVAALIRDVDTLREKGQPLDQKELEALRRDLKTAYRLIEEGQSQGDGETAIIANANSSGDRITVAGGGGIRYEVPVERIPSTQRRPGQTVSVMVSNRRALHSSSHFLGDVGTVGRIVRVLQQDGSPPRLQLHDGFIVEASSDVGGLQPRTGDLVRFDPARLVALE